jgi:hypothetical protein
MRAINMEHKGTCGGVAAVREGKEEEAEAYM